MDRLEEKINNIIDILDFLIEIDTGITGQNYVWIRESLDELRKE